MGLSPSGVTRSISSNSSFNYLSTKDFSEFDDEFSDDVYVIPINLGAKLE